MVWRGIIRRLSLRSQETKLERENTMGDFNNQAPAPLDFGQAPQNRVVRNCRFSRRHTLVFYVAERRMLQQRMMAARASVMARGLPPPPPPPAVPDVPPGFEVQQQALVNDSDNPIEIESSPEREVLSDGMVAPVSNVEYFARPEPSALLAPKPEGAGMPKWFSNFAAGGNFDVGSSSKEHNEGNGGNVQSVAKVQMINF